MFQATSPTYAEKFLVGCSRAERRAAALSARRAACRAARTGVTRNPAVREHVHTTRTPRCSTTDGHMSGVRTPLMKPKEKTSSLRYNNGGWFTVTSKGFIPVESPDVIYD
eukprot:349882_1